MEGKQILLQLEPLPLSVRRSGGVLVRASGGVSVSALGSTLCHVASQTSGMGCSMAYGSAAGGSGDDVLNAAGIVVSRELSVSSTHIGPRPHCLSKMLEGNWFPGLAVACGRSGRRGAGGSF